MALDALVRSTGGFLSAARAGFQGDAARTCSPRLLPMPPPVCRPQSMSGNFLHLASAALFLLMHGSETTLQAGPQRGGGSKNNFFSVLALLCLLLAYPLSMAPMSALKERGALPTATREWLQPVYAPLDRWILASPHPVKAASAAYWSWWFRVLLPKGHPTRFDSPSKF